MAKTRILVAEDSKSIRKITVMQLRNAGFEVIEAEDGMNALGRILTQKPDLVLLDIMMPNLTGWEVCEKIRTTPAIAHLPIIIFSAKNQADDIKIAKHYQVSAYIAKPFSGAKLIERINFALKNPPKIKEADSGVPAEATPAEAPKAVKPTYHIEMKDDIALLPLSGALDKPQILNDSILKALKEYSLKLVIDLSHVDQIKAQSLTCIARAGKLAKSMGGQVKIILSDEKIIKDFDDSDQLENIDYYPTEAEAIASLQT